MTCNILKLLHKRCSHEHRFFCFATLVDLDHRVKPDGDEKGADASPTPDGDEKGADASPIPDGDEKGADASPTPDGNRKVN